MSNALTQNNPYANRFEKMLKPLQSRLDELEKNLDSIKDDHPYKQQARLDVLEEINKTKQDIENTKKNLECSKEMNVIRSDKVPSNIQDHNVWNDCWYDEERKAFVTFNKYFEGATNTRTRDIQIQYDKDNGNQNSGVILEEEKIQFRFGYPAMLQKDSGGNPTQYLLSTLSEEMLTTEIVKAKFRPESYEKSVLYRTESETWIDVLGTNLTEREYELACEVVPHLVKTPLEVLKASAGRPYDQKLFEKQMAQINQQNLYSVDNN